MSEEAVPSRPKRACSVPYWEKPLSEKELTDLIGNGDLSGNGFDFSPSKSECVPSSDNDCISTDEPDKMLVQQPAILTDVKETWGENYLVPFTKHRELLVPLPGKPVDFFFF